MATYPTPNLASILRTLSAYTPASQPEPPPTVYYPQPHVPLPLEDGELSYEPPYKPADLSYEPPYEPAELPYEPPTALEASRPQPTAPPTPYEPQQPLPHLQSNPQLQPQPQSQPPPPHSQSTPQQISKKPVPPQPTLPSASTITTWPPALRHVTLHLAQNEEVMLRIKHLISTQHSHERQWWVQREALLKTQRGREEGRRRLDGVLSAVGGHIAPIKHVHDPQTEKAELERFDRKVYIACREMVTATTAELDRLGVPFFRLQKGLLVAKGEKAEGKLDEEELLRLRGKMLGLLEDLCRD